MELRDAIKTAVRFTWKGKQHSARQYVRFLPQHNGTPAQLYAHNGPEGVLINLDVDVPNAMFDGEVLANIAKDAKELGGFHQSAQRTWALGGVQMDSGNVAGYPSLPPPPGQFEVAPDWWAVEQVFHAVSRDKQRQDLMCVHFTPTAVEATDRHRVARVFVRGAWDGLVAGTLFKQWPKGEVSYAFGETLAAFQIGDERRLASLVKGRFESCDDVLPALWKGPTSTVETAKLIEGVKQLKGLVRNDKDKDLADLRFAHSLAGEPIITLMGRGFVHHQEVSVFYHGDQSSRSVTLRVNVRWLYEALQQVSTPSVRLGFTGPGDALRIDSGAFTAGIWPFVGD